MRIISAYTLNQSGDILENIKYHNFFSIIKGKLYFTTDNIIIIKEMLGILTPKVSIRLELQNDFNEHKLFFDFMYCDVHKMCETYKRKCDYTFYNFSLICDYSKQPSLNACVFGLPNIYSSTYIFFKEKQKMVN